MFEIDGLSFFSFGGGNSIDKAGRQIGLSWWPEEMPSDYEYEECISNLEKVNWKVDYVLTHSCPEFVANQLVTYIYPGEEALQRYFNHIAENLELRNGILGTGIWMRQWIISDVCIMKLWNYVRRIKNGKR